MRDSGSHGGEGECFGFVWSTFPREGFVVAFGPHTNQEIIGFHCSDTIGRNECKLQGIFTISIANLIVLIPMILNGHPGTKYGIPLPVLARASFGVWGANIPSMVINPHPHALMHIPKQSPLRTTFTPTLSNPLFMPTLRNYLLPTLRNACGGVVNPLIWNKKHHPFGRSGECCASKAASTVNGSLV